MLQAYIVGVPEAVPKFHKSSDDFYIFQVTYVLCRDLAVQIVLVPAHRLPAHRTTLATTVMRGKLDNGIGTHVSNSSSRDSRLGISVQSGVKLSEGLSLHFVYSKYQKHPALHSKLACQLCIV